MTETGASAEDADAIWRGWMIELLSAAAQRFSLAVTGPLVWGWRDRSVGAATVGAAGPRWLRVVTEDIRWAHGDWWTGNSDANIITGITKPLVLGTAEWEDGPRKVRAEVMTLVSGHPCSLTDFLTAGLKPSGHWWLELRRSLEVLTATQTSLDTVQWGTVHGDLHWANLFQPQFAIIDWEWWGRGPVGLDAATLYCYSLLTPAIAQQVHDTFDSILSSPQGALAQLYACARLLSRAERGDYPQLSPLLRRHGEQLACTLAR
jgi:hypothetical protein